MRRKEKNKSVEYQAAQQEGRRRSLRIRLGYRIEIGSMPLRLDTTAAATKRACLPP